MNSLQPNVKSSPVVAPRGGQLPPSSLQGKFSNLSKSGEKSGGGGTFVTSVQLFRSNLIKDRFIYAVVTISILLALITTA